MENNNIAETIAEAVKALEKVNKIEVSVSASTLYHLAKIAHDSEDRVRYLEGRISDILCFLQNPTTFDLLAGKHDGDDIRCVMERITEIVKPVVRE